MTWNTKKGGLKQKQPKHTEDTGWSRGWQHYPKGTKGNQEETHQKIKGTGTEDKNRKVQILYNNINGHTKKMWDEIEMQAREKSADIICLTETHWREGHKGRHLNGDKRHWRRRPADG